MANNYAYALDGKAYLNITNKCHNACTFCIRNSGDGVCGTPLWLDREPTADEVMRAFGALNVHSDEVVFCGYGEPTENLEVLKECARRLKESGHKTRLNTNGLGDLVNGRPIAAELKDIDIVSVSLNDCDAQKYLDTTRSEFGLDAWAAVIKFACDCKACGKDVVFTVVDTIGREDIAACDALCRKLGIPLRVRTYISDNYNGNGRREQRA